MRKWGVSVKEISRIFECSEATIYNVLSKKNG
jgi:transposase